MFDLIEVNMLLAVVLASTLVYITHYATFWKGLLHDPGYYDTRHPKAHDSSPD
jgi:hypothetical protein